MTGLTTVEFLSQLRSLNVALSVHGDRLRLNAPAGGMTPELKSELAARKEEILKLLSEASQTSSSESQAIPKVSREERLPLSFAQQRLWFLARMDGVSEAYHILRGLSLKGDLDRGALRRALDSILARHEALRTTFTLMDGEPVQRIAAAADSYFVLIEHDLRGRSDAHAELARLADLEAISPFDLEAGPLIRGRLVQLAENEHVLLLTMHHIVSDGWSMGVLMNELSTLYGAHLRGEGDQLPELTVQYADYAVWQRRWIEGERLKQQGAYWKKTLAGAPALIELPTDHPRPAEQSYAGSFVDLNLDEELTAGLKELSRRHGVTLFMTLIAGWAALLARLSGQQDVLIGTPSANRGRVEIENLIGFFVNTVVLRLELTGSLSVGELLEQTKARAVEAQQHQDIPFEQVVELAQPARSLAHSSLFQVMFAWQNAAKGKLELPGLETQALTSPHRLAKFDLTLELREMDNAISGGLEYATALFERGTVARFLGYYRNLLKAMVADDAVAIDRLPILPEAERQHLLYGLNDTRADFPSDKCIHEMFEERVLRTPDATAVVYEDVQISYAELNGRANRLARYLWQQGVKPDDCVAICVERGPEMITALFAVLKAGGAYVPLDPAYPATRLKFMLEDSAPVALLTQAHLCGQFAGLAYKTAVIDLTAEASALDGLSGTNLDPSEIGLSPNHLAYVIYTSGSTGNPKGVMIEHRGLCNLVGAQIEGFAVEPDSRVLQFASFSFDACISEILMTLCRGAALYLPKQQEVLVGENLTDAVARHSITHVTLPPAVLAGMPENARMDSIQVMVVAGDAVTGSLLKRWGPGRKFINAYGPTEITVCATMHTCDVGEPGNPPIGRPIANTKVYILDQNRCPVPVGVPGEMYIGGLGVARGYLNRPELTVERFVPDLFSSEPGARMYRTGDLARWLADGNIEYLGRNDFQVKILGFRIELGEIEARLAEHPAVREAAVIASEGTSGNKRLVAYYTTSPSGEQKPETAGAEQFRAYLSASLPHYMVPAAYVCLESLPLTPNGKLDRKALPAPEADSYSTRGYEPPQGEIEMKLAAVWAEVLKLDRIGRNDNFFDMGGHSLLAVQLMLRTQELIPGEILPVRAILEAPTVERFAAWLQSPKANQSQILVRMKRGSTARPPLFCVTGVGGNPISLYTLAAAAPQDLSFYALQAKGLDGSEPFHSVEEAASCYLEEIRKVQPSGPYYLAGSCYGGLPAYEMARMLDEMGEVVGALILIDTYNPVYFSAMSRRELICRHLRYYRRRTSVHVHGVLSIRPGEWGSFFWGRFKALFKHILHLGNAALYSKEAKLPLTRGTIEILSSASGTDLRAILERVDEVNKVNRNKFAPKPYRGKVVILRPDERNQEPVEDEYLGWTKLVTGGIESFEIKGSHDDMFQDYAIGRQIFERIDAKLKEAAREIEEANDLYAAAG